MLKVTYTFQQAEIFGGSNAANIAEKHSELCEVHSVRYSAEYHKGLTAEEPVQSACKQGE
jgi:hypothetical protein